MGLKKPSTQLGLHEVVEREHARDLHGLLQQLKSPEAGQRRWAARDLAPYPQSAPTLGEALLSERDASVRSALFTSLAGFATDEAVTALLPLLRSEDAALRNGAIEALAEMPQAVAPRINTLLHDNDPDVRIFTVNLLGDLKHPDINIWLTKVLTRDEHVNVVAAAIEVVAEVGTPEAVPALQSAVLRFSSDPFLGFAADMAIERIESV